MGVPSAEQLKAWVEHHCPDGPPPNLVRIPTGKFNDSYFVEQGDTKSVLRVAPPDDTAFLFYERNMMRQEPGLHSLLRERTGVPVAEVRAFDDTRELLPVDCMLMERLPGGPLSETPVSDVDRVLHRVGQFLREVHDLTEAHYGYLGEHRPMTPQPTWADAFSVMWNRLLDDVVATGHYSAAEADHLRRLLDRHIAVFDTGTPARLLHMDIWAQNILVDRGGQVTGLVDWDRALWGDPEIEFAVLDYCGISEPAFWEGYGQPRDTSAEHDLRRVFYLLYELQKYIVIRHGRSRDPAAARRYRDQSLRLAAQIPRTNAEWKL